MRKRPSINLHCPASRYALPDERILEFTSRNGGGLISIMVTDDGIVRVDVYRADASVRVNGMKLTVLDRKTGLGA